jgi:hypothetical protein
MSKLFLRTGTGEILAESIISHGVEINISQLIVDHAGLMDQPAQLPIELTFLETEPGLI